MHLITGSGHPVSNQLAPSLEMTLVSFVVQSLPASLPEALSLLITAALACYIRVDQSGHPNPMQRWISCPRWRPNPGWGQPFLLWPFQ